MLRWCFVVLAVLLMLMLMMMMMMMRAAVERLERLISRDEPNNRLERSMA
jgi:hypothetical protein